MSTAVSEHRPNSGLVVRIGERFGVQPEKLLSTLKATAFRVNNGPEPTNEQMMALLVVADQYKLNPFTREIYAFPDKQNGIVPVVGVDGWSRIINSHPQFDGMEFRYSENMVTPEGASSACWEWCEVIVYRKDRSHPIVVREYLDEVYRPPFKTRDGREVKGPWQSHPKRFLRHKTTIQGARLAFGFVGIFDQDEAERIATMEPVAPAAPPARAELAPYPDEDLVANLPKWREVIQSGRRTPDQIIAMVETKGSLSDEQREAIRNCAAVDAESEEVDPDGPIPGLDDDDPASEGGAR
ncbi:MAG: phage recombination protein Bet [Pseudomonadales bacterium]|jgi:phage recombination protein Bet|nr:phage recombination protein Bet [Pseudomonadales bacterium]